MGEILVYFYVPMERFFLTSETDQQNSKTKGRRKGQIRKITKRKKQEGKNG
jgi:hypothetical protein